MVRNQKSNNLDANNPGFFLNFLSPSNIYSWLALSGYEAGLFAFVGDTSNKNCWDSSVY